MSNTNHSTGQQNPNNHNHVSKRPFEHNQPHVSCPRCKSDNTNFSYFNNYSLLQPRYYCKTCKRYWTHGGALRFVPVGSGRRKQSKVSSRRNDCGMYYANLDMVDYSNYSDSWEMDLSFLDDFGDSNNNVSQSVEPFGAHKQMLLPPLSSLSPPLSPPLSLPKEEFPELDDEKIMGNIWEFDDWPKEFMSDCAASSSSGSDLAEKPASHDGNGSGLAPNK